VNQEQEPPGPGVVVLSPSLQVLHMNRQAMVLLNQLKHTAQSVGAERAFSAPLHQPCRDITETLQARLRSNNWEQFQLCRTIGDSPHRIVLKGFGIPDRRGLSHSRIVMLLFSHTAQSMPRISRRESFDGISERDYLGGDSPPPAIGM
jgi:hypothetical protein